MLPATTKPQLLNSQKKPISQTQYIESDRPQLLIPMKPSEKVTFEGSTLWKFLTTEITRSVTSDLSRNDPLTSSEKRRRSAKLEGSAGDGLTLTLRYRSRAFLAAIAVFQKDNPGGVSLYSTTLSSTRFCFIVRS